MKGKSGVVYYTTGLLPVHFANGEVCCRLCPLLAWRKNLRYECAMTAEILIYPDNDVGRYCPIQFQTEEASPCKSPEAN